MAFTLGLIGYTGQCPNLALPISVHACWYRPYCDYDQVRFNVGTEAPDQGNAYLLKKILNVSRNLILCGFDNDRLPFWQNSAGAHVGEHRHLPSCGFKNALEVLCKQSRLWRIIGH